MSIDIPPRGSRGAKVPDLPQPLKLVALKVLEIVRRLQRSPLGVLRTVGAKSGVERTVPLRRFDEGPGQWLVVASLGGAARNPAWLHNLAAHPEAATFEVGGRRVPVTATSLSGAERDAAWARIVSEAPGFAAYQEGTDRLIPVVRLTRRDTSA